MTRFAYPVSLDVSGRRAVVVGEEAVAQGKVEALRMAGAEVTVVADRPLRPSDLEGAFVCVASSPHPDERQAIAGACRRRGVLVNVMDDSSHCDFAAPAVVTRGDLTISVSTSGRSPALAARLRDELEERYGPEWAEMVDVIGDTRDESNAELPDLPTRIAAWRRALDLEELRALVLAGRADEAHRRLRERLLGVPVP